MKKYFICGLLCVNLAATNAWGYVCSFDYCPDTGILQIVRNCTTEGTMHLGCLGDTVVNTCNECRTGYKRVLVSATYAPYSCDYEYYICETDCTGCNNCTSDADWSEYNTGYQKKTTRRCDCNTCRVSTEYRCAPGYYGSSTDGTSGCDRCPSSGGIFGTSDAGSTAMTSCYLPAGTTASDESGSYIITENCYYTE